MKSKDVQATNIFSRVFSYTPRSEDRTPLEDFCTEALAWCIIHSLAFEKLLLDKIRKKLTAGRKLKPFLRDYNERLDVDTQFPFFGEDDDGGASLDTPSCNSARFDILLQSSKRKDFVIVIESKVKKDASLESQLNNYRLILDSYAPWKLYEERYIVSLTHLSKPSKNADIHISWGEVQSMLEGLQDAAIVHQQFAGFLTSQYLGNIKLMKMNSAQIAAFSEIASFLSKMTALFGMFRERENLCQIFSRRQAEHPLFECDDSKSGEVRHWFQNLPFYIISDNDNNPKCWAGFLVKNEKLWLYITAIP